MSVEPKTAVLGSQEPQLPVLRFSLRSLLVCVTAICVLIAVLTSAAEFGLASVALLLAVLVVVLHVSGTAIGTRLRAHADQRQAWEVAHEGAATHAELPVTRVKVAGPLSRSPLHGRGFPLRRMPLWIAAGAIVGGSLGMAILAATIGHRTSAAGVVVGALSTAVVGAWFAFLGASFWAIARAGWRDAVREHTEEKVG